VFLLFAGGVIVELNIFNAQRVELTSESILLTMFFLHFFHAVK